MSSPVSSTRVVDLGPAQDFGQLPAPVVIADAPYFLVRDKHGWRLLSAVCPHLGGTIEDCGDVLRCPNHSWAFKRETGVSTGFARLDMSAYVVEERNGSLFAHAAEHGWSGVRARQREETAARIARSRMA
ncbi:MAG TPA: Rieske 2Fe-2S domain-containing protein [Pseudonocardiaceae bacterium]|nr:Rieske 2Fe-2S domain-containing protein [Pseudonocardiaceae bacterium]